jgi:hypothetical protein
MPRWMVGPVNQPSQGVTHRGAKGFCDDAASRRVARVFFRHFHDLVEQAYAHNVRDETCTSSPWRTLTGWGRSSSKETTTPRGGQNRRGYDRAVCWRSASFILMEATGGKVGYTARNEGRHSHSLLRKT